VIDTNVILDWLLERDPARLHAADQLISGKTSYEIPDAVMMELIYVLLRYCKLSREAINNSIELLMKQTNLDISRQVFGRMLDLFQNNTTLAPIDCYILSAAEVRNKLPVWKYDKKMIEVGSGIAQKPK
jgi:predicted nucleic-acid-binding protein